MLVFFSDVHWTDGSSGETVSEEAFVHFLDHVGDLARKRRAEEVRVVLLGDGLDVLRSRRWLDAGPAVRPWSPPSEAQRRIVLEILRKTLEHNRRAVECLREMAFSIASRSAVPFSRIRLDYVLGNHDWLVNRYAEARRVVASAFDLPRDYISDGFPLEFSSPPGRYDVVARHGDVYDRLNYDASAGRDASSLGDALVTDLVNRFPMELAKELDGREGADEVVRRMADVDNVRPYTVIPAWIGQMLASLGGRRPDVVTAARRALERCVADFRADLGIRRLARRQLTRLERLYLGMLLHQAPRRGMNVLDFCTGLAERLIKGRRLLKNLPGSAYCAPAIGERHADGRLPRFVVYGHTHKAESVPIGPHARGGERFYLNTGTWRGVWERARTSDGSEHFATWKEMSYVVLYTLAEGSGNHEFEIWTGSLRDRGAPPPLSRRPLPVVPAGSRCESARV